MDLSALRTPAALVDLDVVERNCARMGERIASLGARLRPHVKTHKCVEAARLSTKGQFGGVTVSTLAEARGMAAAGIRDLTWAVPFAPQRLEEAAEIAAGVERLSLLLDTPGALETLEEFARSRRVRLPVFLKVDCGYHRAGVDPRARSSVELGLRLARSSHLDFRGVLTHAGHAYACQDREAIRDVAREERETAVGFAKSLRAAGARVEEVSIGSTPTMSVCEDLTGVTEVRPGNYVFHDAFQAAIGICAAEDAAFSVLATVIGLHPDRGALIVDAGALALSKDAGPEHIDPRCGFGLVRGDDGRPLAGLRVAALSQEHGRIEIERPDSGARLAVGSRLRIVANHSCLAAAQFERFHVVRGKTVVDEWRPLRGW